MSWICIHVHALADLKWRSRYISYNPLWNKLMTTPPPLKKPKQPHKKKKQKKHARTRLTEIFWIRPWDVKGRLVCSRHQHCNILAVTCDFQKCGILTSVDSDEPLQPICKLRNPKWCSLVGWFWCFTSQVNSYGHCGTVSSPNHTFSWAGLNKRKWCSVSSLVFIEYSSD